MTDALEQEAAPEPTIEDNAREMGWRPKEEFKGPEDRWVDAETFVKRGEEILPILRANSKKDREALDKANAEIAEMKKTFVEFKKHHSQTEQRVYQRARQELERELADAVQAQDFAAVRSITNDIADLSKDARTDDNGDPYQAPDQVKALNAWKSENPWFESDEAMTAAAVAIANRLEASGVKGDEQRAEVAKRIRAEFPQKFANERRAQPSVVEGATPPRKASKGWNDLPPEAKATAEKWVKQGLISKENYVKDYFAQ